MDDQTDEERVRKKDVSLFALNGPMFVVDSPYNAPTGCQGHDPPQSHQAGNGRFVQLRVSFAIHARRLVQDVAGLHSLVLIIIGMTDDCVLPQSFRLWSP